MPSFRALWIALPLTLATSSALAAAQSTCPTPYTTDSAPRLESFNTEVDANSPMQARAHTIRTQEGGMTELEGEVEMIRGGDTITANRIRYDKKTNTATADGAVQFENAAGDKIRSEDIKLQLDNRIGEAGPNEFVVRGNRARGDAEKIEFRGEEHTRFNKVRYTTCQPGQDDWFLKVRRLDLDHEEEIGTARHATVEFFDVPIFYFPYLNFPISSRRKSGFLFPRIGRSDNLGYEASAPYYFNLAPNYDDTFTPRLLTKRGVQIQNEFRYLTTNSEGEFAFEYLDNDKVRQDDRSIGTFLHKHSFNELWSGNIDLRGVSDKDYFNDFGERLGITSQSHLPQKADLSYRGPDWTFITNLVDHQTIDKTILPADRPYARLPQVQLLTAAGPMPNKWYPQMESEWNHFEHSSRLTGERFNLNTGVSLPLENSWGFVTPKIGSRYVGYQLNREEDPDLELIRGVFSVDSGVVFERETKWGESTTTQTLEPRLFYLYIPPKNQDNYPNFDTGVPDLNFASLFRENRFTGGDRIGDANQITAAVSTRFIDNDEGTERLRLSLGRIYYFADQEVNLPPGPTSPAYSDVVAEAAALLVNNWHVRDTVVWNTHYNRTERNNLYLQYQPARNKIVNLGKVYLRDQIDQLDASFEWPMFGRWSVRARQLYSRREQRNLESYMGVEYNACCWAVRVTASRRFQDPSAPAYSGRQVRSILFELELTGLSKFGDAPESPLKHGLFSFDDELPPNAGR